jgi:hypothetical protein
MSFHVIAEAVAFCLLSGACAGGLTYTLLGIFDKEAE